MNGRVDATGRALITVSIGPSAVAPEHEIDVWIDTGFNSDLVLPQKTIDGLALGSTGTVKAILADGSEIALQRFTCLINWFGKLRELEVVANAGEFPLLGVGLLANHDLHISYRTGGITIQ